MRYRLLTAGLLVLAVAGCESEKPVDEAGQNSLMVRLALDQSVHNATVSLRTIYPHYFEPESAVLNGLGEREIEALASAYRAVPARINVFQGDASAELYAARVETVRKKLVSAGLVPSAITITDGLPGGPGLPSAYVADTIGRNPADENRSTPETRKSGKSAGGTSSHTAGTSSSSSSSNMGGR